MLLDYVVLSDLGIRPVRYAVSVVRLYGSLRENYVTLPLLYITEVHVEL